MSWALDDLAAFCDTGAWQDLTPYIEQDGMEVADHFPPSVERYTGFGGKRCAFPFLTDAVGLYYNKDLLEAKGYSEATENLLGAHGDGEGPDRVQP